MFSAQQVSLFFFAFAVLVLFELFAAFVVADDFGAAVALGLVVELDFSFAASEVEDFLVVEVFRFVDCETPVSTGAPEDAAARVPRPSGAGAPCANTAPPGSESPTKDATNIPNFTGP